MDRAFHFFDPAQEYTVHTRRLPHWEQPGATYFITFRTADSLPRSVLETWQSDRRRKLAGRLPEALRRKLKSEMTEAFHDLLDACHGECPFRNPAAGAIVAESLRHFDCDRYSLAAYVVMPNHVHILASIPGGDGALAKQNKSWKHYTATALNRLRGPSGHFWQAESFDHIVRSEAQFEYFRRYIADNPGRARLRNGEFIHWDYQMSADRAS